MEQATGNSNIWITLAPYITSVICAVIAGVVSCLVNKKQLKASLQQITKQHSLDLKKEREKFELEKERLNIEHQNQLEQERNRLELEYKHQLEIQTAKLEMEHKHQMELQKAQTENQMGAELMNTVLKELMKTPEAKNMIRTATRK